MRISDWSSDVCSSDLRGEIDCAAGVVEHRVGLGLEVVHEAEGLRRLLHQAALDGAGTAVGAQEHHREVYAAAVRPAAPQEAEAGGVRHAGQQIVETPGGGDVAGV